MTALRVCARIEAAIRWLPDMPEPIADASTAAATAARDLERAAATRQSGRVIDDDSRLGLRLANAVWKAVNSTREPNHGK